MNSLSLYKKIWFRYSTPQINESPLLTKNELQNKALCFSLMALTSRQINSFNLRRNRLFIDSLKNLSPEQLESVEIFLTLFTIEAEQGNLRTSLINSEDSKSSLELLGGLFDTIKIEIKNHFENIQNLNDLQNQYILQLKKLLGRDSFYDELKESLVKNFIPLIIQEQGKPLFDLKNSSEIIDFKNSNSPFLVIKDEKSLNFYFQRTAEAETKIKEIFGQRLLNESPLNFVLKDLKNNLYKVLTEYSLRANEKLDSKYFMNYRQQSATALACLKNTLLITGGPGTGKTSVVVQIIRTLHRLDKAYLNQIALCAPTGRAAARLQESIANSVKPLAFYDAPSIDKDHLNDDLSLANLSGSTLHRLLAYDPSSGRFKYNHDNKLPHKLVVVDEVSMLDVYLFSALMSALKPETQLILLGDRNQLPSVDAGSVLGDFSDVFYCDNYQSLSQNQEEQLLDLLEANLKNIGVEKLDLVSDHTHILKDRILILSESHRSEKSILELASAINSENDKECEEILNTNPLVIHEKIEWPIPQKNDQGKMRCLPSGIRWLESQKQMDLDFISTLDSWVLDHYTSDKNQFKESGPLNSINQALKLLEKNTNQIFSRYIKKDHPLFDSLYRLQISLDEAKILTLNREGSRGCNFINENIQNSVMTKNRFKINNQKVYSGMPLMISKNANDIRLFNGDTGIVVEDEKGFKVSFFRGEGFELIPMHLLPDWECAYAMTVHKSQGSEFEHVLLVLPEKENKLLTREILYTAVTRAKYFVGVFGDSKLFAKSVKNKIKRNSGIVEFLDGLG